MLFPFPVEFYQKKLPIFKLFVKIPWKLEEITFFKRFRTSYFRVFWVKIRLIFKLFVKIPWKLEKFRFLSMLFPFPEKLANFRNFRRFFKENRPIFETFCYKAREALKILKNQSFTGVFPFSFSDPIFTSCLPK